MIHVQAYVLDFGPFLMNRTLTYDDQEHALLNQQLSAIGPYVLRKPIGAGGMGAVYLAEQTGPLQRQVAIKVTRIELGSVGRLARFEAERQILATLKHPNIAQIFDAGNTAQGHPYLVMEYIDGPTIDQFANNAELSVRERIQLILQVCGALGHAHQNGVIHRDVKPDNILVENHLDDSQASDPVTQARVKLIDFGIAKLVSPDAASQTETGRSIGTPAYMSPEQRSGHNDIDTRTDVYSLGLTLYHLLTRQLPNLDACAAFLDKPSAVIGRSSDRELRGYGRDVDGKQLGRSFVADLDWVVLKACAYQRADRYSSIGEFASDLQRYLDGLPVLAAPPSRWYEMKKYVQRHRWQTAFSLAFIVVGALAGFAVFNAWQQERAARALADQQLQQHLAFNAFVLHVLSTAKPRVAGTPTALSDVIAHAHAELPKRFSGDPFAKRAMQHLLGEITKKMEPNTVQRTPYTQAEATRQQPAASLP